MTTTPTVADLEQFGDVEIAYSVECCQQITLYDTDDLADARVYLRRHSGAKGHQHQIIQYTSITTDVTP